MFDTYLDIVEQRDGYRVRLEHDDDAQFPDGDVVIPTLQIDSHGYGQYSAEAMNDSAAFALDAFRRMCGEYSTIRNPLEAFERWLKVFHGAIKVQEYNLGRSREYGYLSFDTPEWREMTGATPERLKDEDYLEEIRAWAEGDVYGVIVEKQLHYTKTYAEDPAYSEEDAEWVEVEDGALWGHYGRDWAEQAARDALTSAIEWDANHPAPEESAAPEGTPERPTLLSKLERVLEDLEAGAVEVAKTRIRGLIQEEGK